MISPTLLSLALLLAVPLAAEDDWQLSYTLAPEFIKVGSTFGAAIDIDGNRAVFGASNYKFDGMAWIFRKQDGNWTLEDTLTPSRLGRLGSYGSPALIRGDMAVVGSALQQGDIFVFERNKTSSSWIETQRLLPSDWPRDMSGHALAFDGDTIVMGLMNPQSAAYVFTRDNGSWSQVARLDCCHSVAVDGDILAVGVGKADDRCGAVENGSVSVYDQSRQQDPWAPGVQLTAPNNNTFRFGRRVSLGKGLLVVVGLHVNRQWPTVDVFRLNATSRQWNHEGQPINGDGAIDSLGRVPSVVVLDSNRFVLAGPADGPVVFEFVASRWVHTQTVPAPYLGAIGTFIAATADGQTLAAGNPTYHAASPGGAVYFFDLSSNATSTPQPFLEDQFPLPSGAVDEMDRSNTRTPEPLPEKQFPLQSGLGDEVDTDEDEVIDVDTEAEQEENDSSSNETPPSGGLAAIDEEEAKEMESRATPICHSAAFCWLAVTLLHIGLVT